MKVGETYTNNAGRAYTVLRRWAEKRTSKKGTEYVASFARVRFESGYETDALYSGLVHGTIKDYGVPTVFGVGYSEPRAASDHKRVFSLWRCMLARCYHAENENFGSYGAKGVQVCDRWLIFRSFREDLKSLPRYQEWLTDKRYQLDKDIRGDGKLYSPETCMFVTPIENSRARRYTRNRVLPSGYGSDGPQPEK